MKKIPVGATIAHAYRFAFGQYFNLLKLLWLPLLIAVVLNGVSASQMLVLSQGLRTHDYSALSMPAPLVILAVVAVQLFGFMAITGTFQYALEKAEAEGRRFYLSFAMPLWRLIGAFLLMILVMVILLLVYVLAAIVVLFLFRFGLAAAHVSDTALKGIMAFDGALAFLAGYCGAIYCWIRFGFLLGAATIADDRIGLFRSWTLSHHNFWRMLAVSLAIFLPMLAVEIIALFGLGFFPHFTPGATPAQIQAAQAAASAAAMAQMQHYGYIIYPLGILIAVIFYGLMAGASVFAWRALTEDNVTPNPL